MKSMNENSSLNNSDLIHGVYLQGLPCKIYLPSKVQKTCQHLGHRNIKVYIKWRK